MKKLSYLVLVIALAVGLIVQGIGLALRADMAEHPDIAAAVTSASAEAVPTPTPTVVAPADLNECIENAIDSAAAFYQVDADLIRAVIWVESRGQVDADNGQCFGLMQLNRDYASTFKAGAHLDDLTLPANNVLAGTWWLSELLARYDGDEVSALMAYNLGPTGADKKLKAGEYGTDYSAAVLAARDALREVENG